MDNLCVKKDKSVVNVANYINKVKLRAVKIAVLKDLSMLGFSDLHFLGVF